MFYWLFKKYMKKYEKEKIRSLAYEIKTKLPNKLKESIINL